MANVEQPVALNGAVVAQILPMLAHAREPLMSMGWSSLTPEGREK
jgi:hypothetical protein